MCFIYFAYNMEGNPRFSLTSYLEGIEIIINKNTVNILLASNFCAITYIYLSGILCPPKKEVGRHFCRPCPMQN